MRGRVSADPDRLEGYSTTTLPLLPPVKETTDDYRRTIQRLNEAPNDVSHGYIDASASISAQLELLRELDRGPEALAFALRNLDDFRGQQSTLASARFGELDLLAGLSSAYLANPDATASVLLQQAEHHLDDSWRLPWDDGVGDWLLGPVGEPSFWASTTIGTALGTVVQVDARLVSDVRAHTRSNGTRVAGYQRWESGYAQRMNRITSAANVRRVAPWARWGSRSLPFVGAGGVRIYEDWNDPTLTPGDRIARVGSSVVIEGGFAAGGAWGGALLGAAALSWAAPPVGPIVGGVIGGAVGGFVGSQVGATILDNATGAIEGLGRAIDRGIDTMASVGTTVAAGATSVVAGAGSVASTVVDGAGSVASSVVSGAGSAASTVAGWFGG